MDRINVKLRDKAVNHDLRKDITTTYLKLFDIIVIMKTASI